jgi:hypothetical protein
MSMHPNRNLFAEFKGNNRAFIETGSYRGDGIQLALDAGYEKIISIDNNPEAIDFCMNRFDLYNNPNPKIRLIKGDSANCLFDILRCFAEPITFWLDSHWQMLEGTEPGENPFPLLDELNQICQHGKQDHVILIDDLLYMTHQDVTGITRTLLKGHLLDINPNYKFKYLANPVMNNILVAYP